MGIVKFSDKYSESEVLFKNDRSTIHKGIRLDDGYPVLIKSPTENYPSRTKVESFKREFEIGSSLESDYFPKYLEFLEVETSCKVVLSSNKSMVLSHKLKSDSLNLGLKIKIALELIKALEIFHNCGFIHKDIKSDNILIQIDENELKSVQIFDFSLSSRSGKELLEFNPTKTIEGSFHYMSPEQTGRMNRVVDYRTDFYSLGSTLYELFSGKKLFPYSEPIKLVHAHLALNPDYDILVQSKVPEIIIRIIKKLTSKNPEERYQSARGLHIDFENVYSDFLNKNISNEFILGKYDTPSKIILSNKIYGREREIFSIYQIFDKIVETEESQVLLVSGLSGVGKTSLVMEALKPITQKNGIYVSSKFENLKIQRPYSAIIRVIRKILELYLLEDEETYNAIRRRLKEDFTEYSSIFKDSIPELKEFIEVGDDIEKLPPEESKNKLNIAIKILMQCLILPNKPLLIFIDDLQWADQGSIEIVDKILSSNEIKNLFLILSYRSNELDEFHTFYGLIKRKGERWNKIQLENIDDGYVLDFLVDTLQEESYDIEKLAKIISKKSDRNPFYVRQFTENILRKNLIKPSEKQDKKWDIELENINKLNNTDSLLTILLSKIDLLPDSCIEILKFSSLITGKIGLFFISELLKKDPNELLEMIQDAIDLELVILNSNQSETFFTFSHDKILEAFQTGIEPEKKSDMHKSIGDLYYRYYLINRDARMLFYSVDHFNLSNLDSFEVNFLEELVKLNLHSAIESKYIGAYKSAEFYISKSIELQKIPGIVLEKEISDDILINNVEILYLNSRLDEALEFSNSIDKDALTDRQYIILGTIITRIYSKKNNLELSVNNTLTVFKKFGINIPRNKFLLIGKMLFRLFLIKLKVSSLKIDGILNYRVFEDEKYNLLFDLQADTGASTFSYDQNIFVLSVLESLKITFKFGLMKNSIINLSGLGMIFAEVFKDKGYAVEVNHAAIQIADRLNSPSHKWKTLYVLNCFLYHWKQPLRDDIHSFERIMKGSLQSGDMIYAGFSGVLDICKKLNSGYPLSLLVQNISELEKFMKSSEDDFASDFITPAINCIYILSDLSFNRLKSISSESFDEDDFEKTLLLKKNYTAIGCLNIDRIKTCYFLEEFNNAIFFFEMFLKYEKFLSGHLKLVDVYYYAFLSISRKYSKFTEIPRQEIKLLKHSYKKIKGYYKDFPEGFAGKKYLMDAEIYRLRGNLKEVWNAYENAIQSSTSQGLIHEVANAHWVYSRFLDSVGHRISSYAHIKEAIKSFKVWEAYRIVNILEEKQNRDSFHSSDLTVTKNRTISDRILDLDYQSVLKSVKILSSEKNEVSLVSRLLDLILENTGGDYASYILSDGTEKASKSLNGKNNDYPRTIFRYVLNSKKPLLIGNVKEESRFAMDEYFDSHRASSILCYPILIGGVLKAVLYMENSKLTHAFTVDKQEVLSILLSQTAISLQNVEITSNLEKQVQARTKDLDTTLKNIRKDIDVAKKIQMGVLPSQLKFPFPIEIEFYPQSDVGGDLYDITELSKNSYRILIIDATGHGVQGALITMAVKNEYDNIKFTDSPSELLQVLNKKFTNKFKSINALFSAVVVDIDLDKNEIIYSSGGHPDQYLIQDSKIISLEKTGRIIGLSDNSEYKQLTFSFQKGDRLYLFSDGIYERFNSDKEEFGEERFMDLLLEKNSIELNRLYSVIDAKINQFVDGLPPDDDITFIAVEF